MTTGLLDVLSLKALPRSGWVRKGVPAPESVAAHAWGVAWLVLVLLPESLDLSRALSYAVLHDLPEIRVGDLTPHDGVGAADKHAREHAAMVALAKTVPRGPALLRTWEAYEAQADPESRFVRELDRLDMALQAVRYAEDTDATDGFDEFLASAARVITDPVLVPWLDALRARLGGAA